MNKDIRQEEVYQIGCLITINKQDETNDFFWKLNVDILGNYLIMRQET